MGMTTCVLTVISEEGLLPLFLDSLCHHPTFQQPFHPVCAVAVGSFSLNVCATVGTQPPIGTVPVGGPQMYVRSSDPYMNGPPPQGPYPSPTLSSGGYHHMQQSSNFPRMIDARSTRPIPMTTYQQHPVQHHMQPQTAPNRNSHSIFLLYQKRKLERSGDDVGSGMMSGGSDRSKQV